MDQVDSGIQLWRLPNGRYAQFPRGRLDAVLSYVLRSKSKLKFFSQQNLKAFTIRNTSFYLYPLRSVMANLHLQPSHLKILFMETNICLLCDTDTFCLLDRKWAVFLLQDLTFSISSYLEIFIIPILKIKLRTIFDIDLFKNYGFTAPALKISCYTKTTCVSIIMVYLLYKL